MLLNCHIGRFVLVSLCVGDLVRLGLSSISVAGWSTVVLQQHSRKLLMMDILMSETCSLHKKWNKIASDIKLVFYSSAITMIYGSINVSKYECSWFCYSSATGTESSTAESPQPESNKENLLREGWLHCKVTLVDGKVISFIFKIKSYYICWSV